LRRIAAIVVPLLAWPSTLGADATTSGNLVQSTEVTSGRDGVGITHRVRRSDGQLPPAVTELRIDFPPGTRLNTEAFPHCVLATLQAKGPGACAPGSRVGSGTAGAQVPFRFPHVFKGSVRLFNGAPTERSKRNMFVFIRPQAGPHVVHVGRWSGDRRTGWRLVIELATIAYPEAVPDSLVRLSLEIGARRGGFSYLRAPCPGTYRATGRYHDGNVVKSTDRARCN